jgi:uncharacterized protein (DUF1810 family)
MKTPIEGAGQPIPEDSFDLIRFVTAQVGIFETALSELRGGQKQTHWMWFIFPQLDGVGHSPMARKYGIRSLDEAQAYLDHPLLGTRLRESCQVILAINGKSAFEIFGSPDDMKLRSSMTLFSLVRNPTAEFTLVLNKYFGGDPDPRTLELLGMS